MTIQKKIFFLVGGILLLSLSITLLLLYRDDITQEPPAVTTNDRINSEEQQQSETIESINIVGEDNSNLEYSTEDEQLEESEVRENVVEALSMVNLTESYEEPSERSFFEHAILDYILTNVMGDNVAEENDVEDEAEWVAKDLIAWLEVAENRADFSYSESPFLTYVERENLITDDLKTQILLEELRKISETLYIRHLEFKFIKSFIWNDIHVTFSNEHNQSSDEVDEDYLYSLYSQFEEEVMTHLLEKYPELWQD
ncbi:hypothetical protein ACERII_17535 [Evansella sp. AB-rgal1]|uniref:hypothetical protein n=1 Tax=Evansella sp. AB-rgal1 TaxID=3242696 RepID=UPI00359E1C4A